MTAMLAPGEYNKDYGCVMMWCEHLFTSELTSEITAVVSVCRQPMLVDGVSMANSVVVLHPCVLLLVV